jgi:hypothetical protein
MPLAPVAALLLAAASAGPRNEVRVTATPSKSEVGLGETFAVEVHAEGPAGTVWSFPDQAGSDEVDVRSSSSSAAPSPASDVRRYQAAALALGNVVLPPVAVHYRLPDGSEGEARSAPVTLTVRSILPKDPREQTLADIRGPLELPVGAAFWLACAAGLALAAAVAAFFVRRRRAGESVAPPVPELPPGDEARAALARLAASDLLTRGEHRAFYIALTDLAKRYLERRLRAPVLEMTSAEMVAFLRGHPKGGGLATPMRELASAADIVKFARGSGAFDAAQRHLAAVGAMIDAVEELLRPAVDAAAKGDKVA